MRRQPRSARKPGVAVVPLFLIFANARQAVDLPYHWALALGVRLDFDRTRDAWVLLGPERVVETEGPASEILRRCDGSRTIGQIVDELAAVYNADRVQIADDVMEMLAELMAKRMLTG